MIGIILGFFKNMIWVGFTLVEGLVFMIAFNYLAPILMSKWTLTFLPTTHVGYWESVSLFIVIGFLGKFVKKLSPLSVNVKNNAQTNIDNE